MKKQALTVVIMLIALSLGFSLPANLVPNFQNPQQGIFTSGQPTTEGFELLAQQGLKTVINVLPEKYCIRDEADVVRQNGMTYRTVPFDTVHFRKETIEHFADIIKTANKPVLIHCSTGNHAGGVWFAYRVLYENAPVEVALQEARLIGLRPSLEETLVDSVLAARRAE